MTLAGLRAKRSYAPVVLLNSDALYIIRAGEGCALGGSGGYCLVMIGAGHASYVQDISTYVDRKYEQ